MTDAAVTDPSGGRPLPGPDGQLRCPWSVGAAEYLPYHDEEWGRELHGDDALYERLVLEGFQSGLSWITILRKRPAFRAAFDGFLIEKVAEYGETERERLLADAGIVRNRAKVNAAIVNARAALELGAGGLDAVLWSYAPDGVRGRRRPRTVGELPASTPESVAMAKGLKQRGFVFFGPTTAYALMQAVGMVDDHLEGCHVVA